MNPIVRFFNYLNRRRALERAWRDFDYFYKAFMMIPEEDRTELDRRYGRYLQEKIRRVYEVSR